MVRYISLGDVFSSVTLVAVPGLLCVGDYRILSLGERKRDISLTCSMQEIIRAALGLVAVSSNILL